MRCRAPNCTAKTATQTTAVEMADWKNPADIEFCYYVVWCHTRCKVQSIQREGDHAIITMLQPHFTHAREKEGVQVTLPSYIENALELLDEPGEWYLDRAAKTVYYMPLPGEDMTKVRVIAPAVEKLVELRGTLDQPVQNIHFEGITFAEAGWLLPSEIGLVDVQANFLLNWKDPMRREHGITAVHNEQLKSPANVVCHAAKGLRFERCTFTQLGGAGIDLEFGSQDNVISGCRFHDISGTAVQVGDVLKDDHHPDDPRKIVKNNAVVNNYIHDCCVEYMGGVGVFAGYTDGTVIAHNEICRLPYTGISVGWGWGEEDAGGGARKLLHALQVRHAHARRQQPHRVQPHPPRHEPAARRRRDLHAGQHAGHGHPRQPHPRQPGRARRDLPGRGQRVHRGHRQRGLQRPHADELQQPQPEPDRHLQRARQLLRDRAGHVRRRSRRSSTKAGLTPEYRDLLEK